MKRVAVFVVVIVVTVKLSGAEAVTQLVVLFFTAQKPQSVPAPYKQSGGPHLNPATGGRGKKTRSSMLSLIT